ncbi:MAG: TonB-dependent receptor, partial [Myxococcota bacterium]|nr:TonB-dependent receptor [Myxococcota bacterium]
MSDGYMLRMLLVFWILSSVLCSGSGWAEPLDDQVDQTDAGTGIEEIVVRANRVEQRLIDVPASVSVVGEEQIQLARPQLTLGESLAQVPGVFTQNRDNFSQDLRISIRGFGSRAQFGVRGIKLLVDGFPATTPDGQGQVDTLQFSTTGRIEVLRGPSASLYGSAAGGVIRVESEPVSPEPTATARTGFGSNGYRSYELKSSGYAGPVGILVGLSRQQMGGYREHSQMESNVLNSRFHWAVDDKSELMGLFNLVYAPVAEDPGGITADQVAEDRRQAFQRNLATDAGERLTQVTGGLRYRRNWDAQNETTAVVWTASRDFKNNIPIACNGQFNFQGVEGKLDRIFAGGSIQHANSHTVFDLDNSVLVGFSVEAQRDQRNRHCLQDRKHVLDQDENVTSVRAFFRDELGLTEELALSFSLGFDALQYSVTDRLAVTAENPNDSGKLNFSELSPAAALLWNRSSAINAYARVSTSFEPPTTTELRLEPGDSGEVGGFNPNLEAQRALNFEVGLKGMLPGRLRYEVVVYRIWTDDEIVQYELEDGQEYYGNAGETKRHGVEAMVEYEFVPGLIASAAYTYTEAEYTDYNSKGSDFSGNQVPGVPEQHLYAQLRYVHPTGLFAALEGRYIGAFFANDANTVETESYGLLDFRVGWRAEIGSWQLGPYMALSNLTNTKYNDNVRL